MFQAIASYFFRGSSDLEDQSTPLETREVDDWTMVNRRDDPLDEMMMPAASMMESEYEEILGAVSCLMRRHELEPELMEPSDGESVRESSDGEEEEEEDIESIESSDETEVSIFIPWPEDTLLDRVFGLHTARAGRLVSQQEVVEHFDIPPFHMWPLRILKPLQINPVGDLHLPVKPQLPVVARRPSTTFSVKIVVPRVPTPATSSKTDILERIHELQQEQQLKTYRNQKVITKGQLTRQNKNYLFQSSCKKNRRRELQRCHSGANNNRKCC